MDIDYFRKLLRINKHDLDSEFERQSELQEHISRKVAELGTKVMLAKDELAQIDGRLASEIKEDEPKLALALVDSRVRRNSQRRSAAREYQESLQEHEEWSGLLEAWKKRMDGIKGLASLYLASYYSQESYKDRPRHTMTPERNNYRPRTQPNETENPSRQRRRIHAATE